MKCRILTPFVYWRLTYLGINQQGSLCSSKFILTFTIVIYCQILSVH